MAEVVANILREFLRHKHLADRALEQLDEPQFFQRPAAHVNHVALIVKHLGGNLLSRWTDFLSSDGEKATRDRDREFVLTEGDTRENLLAAWEKGWKAVQDTVGSLTDADLSRAVTIRGERLSVLQALLRGATHAAYHTGQILYLVRLLRPDGAWLTVPPGKSRNRPGDYLQQI